jgi:ACS family tartrate transporter-like MFS transporter
LRAALGHPNVLLLAAIYFSIVIGLYGLALWLPQIVKEFGLTILQVGFVTAIPYLVATTGMILWARNSDRRKERIWHVAGASLVGFAGLASSAFAPSPLLSLAALSIAAMGIHASLPVFWALPTAILGGTAAAGAIASINAIGNLSGFLGPYLIGYLKETTGSFSYALLALSSFLALAALLTLWLTYRVRALQQPGSFGNTRESF